MLELGDIFGTENSVWRHYLLMEVGWRNEIKHKRVIHFFCQSAYSRLITTFDTLAAISRLITG